MDALPDCRRKYQLIVKRAKAGMGKWTDPDFAADDKSLGPRLLSNNLVWTRFSEHDGFAVWEDGFHVNDIV